MIDLLLVFMCFILSLTLGVKIVVVDFVLFFKSSYCHLVISSMGCKGCLGYLQNGKNHIVEVERRG